MTTSYNPPLASAPLVHGIDFSKASASPGDKYRAIFAAHDQHSSDPSRCEALLKFPDGTVFFQAKMAIDADGSPRAKIIDPDSGDTNTSLSIGGKAVNSENVPYIVLPLGDFKSDFNLKLGDLAVVIFKTEITAAIFADAGPAKQIGEASIKTHENLAPAAPRPWKSPGKQNTNHDRILNSSIAGEILYFVFPNSRISGLTQINAAEQIKTHTMDLFTKFKDGFKPLPG